MLTSKSTKGCRLTANAPVVIRSCKSGGGLTNGRIDPGDFTVERRRKVAKPAKSKRRGTPRAKNHKTDRTVN